MTPRLRAVLVIGGAVVGMLALLLLVALVTRTPTRATYRGIDHDARSRELAWAQGAKLQLIQNGTITNIDCPNHEVQAEGLAWAMVPRDTKKGVVATLSRICAAETTYRRLTLVDNRSGRTLAEYSITAGVTLH